MYVSPKKVKISIVIWSCTAQNWLRKLGYKYKNVRKDLFVDEHEQSNVVEDWKNFLKKIKELKLYIIEFEENGAMKSKVYSSDYVVKIDNQ